MQQYLRQYGFSIFGSGVVPGAQGGGLLLGNQLGSGDDMIRYCTIVVNNISIDLTPFRTIRYTYNCQFAKGSDGIDGRGNFVVLNTNKTNIKTITNAFYGGYASTTTSDVNVADINQHAFFYADFRSASNTGASDQNYGVAITKIEFLT